MIWNIHAAKTHLSKLIERAEAGEEVIIARAGSPRVRLTPIDPPAAKPTDHVKGSWLGSMRGKIFMSPDFDAENEELGQLMEDGPIFPPDHDD